MSKNNYVLNEQLDHVAYMFNVRTRRKAYENFIVNAIYAKVGNPELMPVTQQYVKDPKDSRKYYLLDLYFPQIKLGVEVDERQHCNKASQSLDVVREQAIRSAIECEVVRIPIFAKGEEGNCRKRSYGEICADIDVVVKHINAKINAIGGLDWVTNDEKIEKVKSVGKFSVDDDVSYRTIADIYNICGGRRNSGEAVKSLQRAYLRLNKNYYLWVPTLSIKMQDDKDVSKQVWSSKHGFRNQLSEDKKIITEYSLNGKFGELENHTILEACNGSNDPTQLRVVFLRAMDVFGKPAIKFIGVFKLRCYINDSTRVFERVNTEIEISELTIKK